MRYGLILGDQLSEHIATLKALDKDQDIILMAELVEEATYVKHHPQKISLIFSAMRHFAKSLKAQGWKIRYQAFDRTQSAQSFVDFVQAQLEKNSADALVITESGEFRLQQAIETTWSSQLQIPIHILRDDRFFCSKNEFKQWGSSSRILRMEFFYRKLRQKTGYLMDGNKPVGGKWNYDIENRQAWNAQDSIPVALEFDRDQIDLDVIELVKAEFQDHIGQINHFNWATTRQQALQALDYFIQHQLIHFGQYQDAMVHNQDYMFHSLLAPYLNCGLLSPKEVCDAAQQAYFEDRVPLNTAEGFIRQILGWREFIRGIYWLKMPSYSELNELQADRELPAYFWTANTKMECMRECLRNSLENAYAHHIQRLMVIGNFTLLNGISPKQVNDWYLSVYADAFEWVQLPNTHGMVLFADGGLVASKPYAASGNYIHRMSNYCQNCHYNVKTKTEQDSCPFNSLYWNFLAKHRVLFSSNPRMSIMYKQWDKLNLDDQNTILTHADDLQKRIEEL